jgi:hypothetical protein
VVEKAAPDGSVKKNGVIVNLFNAVVNLKPQTPNPNSQTLNPDN